MAQATIGALRVVLGLDSAQFTKGLGAAQRRLRQVGKNLQNIGRQMTLAVTAPIALMGAGVLRAAANFDQAMANMRSILKPTQADFERLRDLAKELGLTTKFSATEAAEGMEVLAKNGLRAAAILDGAALAALNFAAASGGTLKGSAEVITDVMINFGTATSDLSEIVDNATGALLNSKLGFEDYLGAVGAAAGVAGPLGMSFQDMNTALAITAASFDAGATTGTSFKGFLQKLVPAGDKARKTIKRLGFEFFTAQGDAKTLSEIAGELQRVLGALSKKQQLGIVTELFGQRFSRSALRLMTEGAEGVEKMAAAIAEVKASEVAAERLKGFNEQLLLLKSALETLSIEIAEAGLLQFTLDLVNSLTDLARRLAEASPSLLKWGTIIAGLTAVIGPLLVAIGFMAARTTIGWELVIPASRPPALLVGRT